MYRMSDLINLPVIESSEGNTLCTAKTVIIDIADHSISAVVCKEGFINKYICMVPMVNIIGLDKNRILIRNKGAIKKVKQSSIEARKLLFFENIVDKVIMDNTGDIMGAIRDVIFDENDGRIMFYEVSEGYIDDITRGRIKIDCSSELDYDWRSGVFKCSGSGSDKNSFYKTWNNTLKSRVQNERLDKIT